MSLILKTLSGSSSTTGTGVATGSAATSSAVALEAFSGAQSAIGSAATGYALGLELIPVNPLGTLAGVRFYGMPESLPARKTITGTGRAVAKSSISQAKGAQKRYHNSAGVAVAASATGGGSGRQNFDRLNDEELMLILS
jgi:hypothetical protein